MSIQNLADELRSIRNELKLLRAKGQPLRKRASELEDQISDYLDSKGQPGMKYKGIAITKEIKSVPKIKKKDDQKTDMIRIAEDYGIRSPEKFIEEFNNAKKGSPQEKRKIKFKTYKDKPTSN